MSDHFVMSNRKPDYPTAKSNPKWYMDGSGILVNKANPKNMIIRERSKWRSATDQEMKRVTG